MAVTWICNGVIHNRFKGRLQTYYSLDFGVLEPSRFVFVSCANCYFWIWLRALPRRWLLTTSGCPTCRILSNCKNGNACLWCLISSRQSGKPSTVTTSRFNSLANSLGSNDYKTLSYWIVRLLETVLVSCQHIDESKLSYSAKGRCLFTSNIGVLARRCLKVTMNEGKKEFDSSMKHMQLYFLTKRPCKVLLARSTRPFAWEVSASYLFFPRCLEMIPWARSALYAATNRQT